jgi:hypothetical protein
VNVRESVYIFAIYTILLNLGLIELSINCSEICTPSLTNKLDLWIEK